MELGAVAVVVFGDFFPIEGSEAGVFVLQELLARVPGDEVVACVGWKMEWGRHLFIDALEVELDLGCVVDVGDEAEAGVAIDGGLIPCAEGGCGAFAGDVETGALGAYGINSLGGPTGIDEAEAWCECFFTECIGALGEEVG